MCYHCEDDAVIFHKHLLVKLSTGQSNVRRAKVDDMSWLVYMVQQRALACLDVAKQPSCVRNITFRLCGS